MKKHAILRFEKRKGGSAQTGGIEKHHERQKNQYASNMDIDISCSDLNYHLIKPTQRYSKEIDFRIKNVGARVRKDSVKFIDTIITASSSFFESKNLEEQKIYFNHALDFIKQNIGEDNIFSAVVHMDEKTPHMHLCFTPITKDGRLSAKEIIGNRAKLIEWQDNFHDYMAERFPELDRGESASLTKRKHVPTWMFKQANKLSEQMAEIQLELNNIGTLNAKKQKEKILDLFSNWNKSVNKFEDYLKPFGERIKELELSNSKLKSDKNTEVNSMNAEIRKLKNNIAEWNNFANSIPDETWNNLLANYNQSQEEVYDNSYDLELE